MLTPLAPSDAQRVRDFLTGSLSADSRFRTQPGFRELPTRHAGNIPYLLDATAAPTAVNAIMRLFLFAMPVPRRVVADVFPGPVLEVLLASGMLSIAGDDMAPQVMLSPLDENWFAADTLAKMEAGQVSDLVLWPNQTTRFLLQAAMRGNFGNTLDLGAGCGVLSVLAAAFSRKVTATDLNPRAASFVEFNASLNGTPNIETLTGDTYEPVRDRKFDLILANPPFFVTPGSSAMYCENSLELDGYCRKVVREGAEHLEENGYLQMTFEFVQLKGESWEERVASWLEDTGCDAWVLRRYLRDPAAYAYERTKDGCAVSLEKGAAKFNEWVSYYRELGVDLICGGMLTIRKRSGSNWVRIEDAAVETEGPVGESILRLFETQTVLHGKPTDADLLQRKPLLTPGTAWEQVSEVVNSRWAPKASRLVMSQGLPSTIAVEFAVAQFLARCDGVRTLADLVHELAQSVKAPPEQIQQQCCSVVRKLAERRFLGL